MRKSKRSSARSPQQASRSYPNLNACGCKTFSAYIRTFECGKIKCSVWFRQNVSPVAGPHAFLIPMGATIWLHIRCVQTSTGWICPIARISWKMGNAARCGWIPAKVRAALFTDPEKRKPQHSLLYTAGLPHAMQPRSSASHRATMEDSGRGCTQSYPQISERSKTCSMRAI